jgi:hypothetical protein
MGLFAAIRSGFVHSLNFTRPAAISEFWNWLLFVVFLAIIAGLVDLIMGFGTITLPTLAVLALPTSAVFARCAVGMERSWSSGLAVFFIIWSFAFWLLIW